MQPFADAIFIYRACVLNTGPGSYTLIRNHHKEGIPIEFLLHKVLALAVLSEIITNFIKTLAPSLDKSYIPPIAGIVGIILSWLTCVGIFSTLDVPVKYAVVDYILTGVIVSRGANIVHDLADKLSQTA